jgi:hypothetical protein
LAVLVMLLCSHLPEFKDDGKLMGHNPYALVYTTCQVALTVFLLPVTPTAYSPRALASCTATWPTPPDAANTSTR